MIPIRAAINLADRPASASVGCVIPKVLMKALARKSSGFMVDPNSGDPALTLAGQRVDWPESAGDPGI